MIWAAQWNDLVTDARRSRLWQGGGVILTATPTGTLVSADPNCEWQHPWWMSLRWEPAANAKQWEWHCYVRPGFVNGIPATIAVPQKDGTSKDIFLTATSKPYISISDWRNPVASSGATADSTGNIIELAGEGYPSFFAALGVKPAALGTYAAATAPYAPPSKDGWRTKQLRAYDVALITPRVATVQSVQIGDTVDDATTVQIASTFNNEWGASHSSQFALRGMPKWTPPVEPTDEERLEGTAVEPDTDEVLIATIYLLSPFDPPDGDDAIPDGSWQAYVQYSDFGFWNLNHAPANPPVDQIPTLNLTMNTGLAGGIGDAIFNSLLAPNNDASQAVSNYLNSISYAGMFWTI